MLKDTGISFVGAVIGALAGGVRPLSAFYIGVLTAVSIFFIKVIDGAIKKRRTAKALS